MKMLRGTHEDEQDNLNELANELRVRYKNILNMPLDERSSYLASLRKQYLTL